MLNKVLFCAILFLCSLSAANGQDAEGGNQISDSMDIDDFIDSAYTPTFDCPTSQLNERVDAALALTSLTPQQNLQLTSMKTHGLICAGNSDEAEPLIQRLLVNDISDRNAQYYLSAIFQYGFIYDLKENPERCDYYVLARDAAKDKYADIHLSASLGFITECMVGDVNNQISGLYQMLETTTQMQDPAALAHAYNRVGLFYSNRSQYSLAASQYYKAYETAKDIYTDENLLPLLGGTMTSLTAAGDLPRVKEVLDLYIAINANVNSPGTNFLQYYFESRYYYNIQDYENLKLSLRNWKEVQGEITSPIYQGLYRRYSTKLCYYNKDLPCLQAFLERERNASAGYLKYMEQSKEYLKFMIEVNILLGNTEGSLERLTQYARKVDYQQKIIMDTNGNIDIASLHVKILNLESTLKEQRETRNQVIWFFVSLLLVLVLILLWFARRKYRESKSYDSVTGILNNAAVVNKLVHLPKPSPKCTNALAIFDIDNFMDVNISLGSTKSDFMLQQIANTLKKITRSSDLLGRFGPKQFILCLVDIEEDAAQAFFERAKEALSNTFADENSYHTISVDSSMSIFYSTESFNDIDEIFKNMLLSLSMKAEQA